MRKIIAMINLFIFLNIVSLVSAQSSDGNFYGCGGMMYGNWGYGSMIFGWIFSVLTLVALILLIFWLLKQIQKK